jgi:hypothetical protein
MNMHRGSHAALGVVILLAASLALAREVQKDKKLEEKAKEKAPDFYPLQPGNERHYKVTANDQESKISTRIAKIENIDGVMLARLEAGKGLITEHLLVNEKGVFRARLNGAEVSPPFQLIQFPAKLGSKWKGTFVVAGEKGKHTYDGAIAAKEETVEVPAGKFKTIRVDIKLESDGQPIDTTYWFAKDVGFVKEILDVAGTVITLELEKFERPKKADEPK